MLLLTRQQTAIAAWFRVSKLLLNWLIPHVTALLLRIPYVASDKARRVEVRFPDPMANPYLCFAALLMAGIDGIQNKIHPGEAADKNLYDLPPEENAKIPTVCSSFRTSSTVLLLTMTS